MKIGNAMKVCCMQDWNKLKELQMQSNAWEGINRNTTQSQPRAGLTRTDRNWSGNQFVKEQQRPKIISHSMKWDHQ